MSNNNSVRSDLVNLANDILLHLDKVDESHHAVIEAASEFFLEAVECYDTSQDNPGEELEPFTESYLVEAARVVFDYMCENNIPCPIPGGVHARFDTDATGKTEFSIGPADDEPGVLTVGERDALTVEECFSPAGLAAMVLASNTDYIN